MSMTDYTSKIKEICDMLGSINVMIDEDEMVQVYLEGLAQMFGSFRMVVCTREKMPSFFNLQSMLLVEENHVGVSKSTHTHN